MSVADPSRTHFAAPSQFQLRAPQEATPTHPSPNHAHAPTSRRQASSGDVVGLLDPATSANLARLTIIMRAHA